MSPQKQGQFPDFGQREMPPQKKGLRCSVADSEDGGGATAKDG